MASVDAVFKALGDPIRIRIVQMLAKNGEMCVCRIVEELCMTQPAVSHHLSVMKNAALVSTRREGQWIHYALHRDALEEVALGFLQGALRDLESAANNTSCTCCEEALG